ncbi:MAG: AAA family ATPase [Candidatus Melainabacteria bacterium]|nr:AAA family ATPase [Candidatus Melainabacteria bacterium]
MDKKGFIWFVVIAFLAIFLFQGQGNKTDAVKPQAATYDLIRKTVETDAKAVEKVIFLKDDNGTVQEVLLTFKETSKPSLKAQIPGDAGISRLLAAADQAGVPTDAKTQEPNPYGWLITLAGWIVPMLVLFFLFQFIMRGAANAQNGMRDKLGASNAKKFEADKDRKTFKDVAGCDEAKQELKEVIDYLRNPGLLAQLGGKPPKGVLLVGGPGTGKTLLAKAVAGEANAAFFSISASQFVEMFVGVGAARVRDLFNNARENKPAIVFIDELDAVGRQRGTGVGGGNDEREQTLNQLLVEMDGFRANDGVILMAATNRPDVLDPALTRPGRFDLQVLVDNPDKFGRHEILQIHTKNKKLGPDVDLDIIATNTPGFSGAELEGTANNAAIVAARRINNAIADLRAKKVPEDEINKQVPRVITMADMDEGVDRVQMGPAKEGAAKRMNPLDMENTAFHELGHAWVSQVMFEKGLGGDPVTKITIVPRARALGYVQALPRGDRFNYTNMNLKARIMMAMGGRAAQEIFLNTIDTGASNDFKQAKAWAYRMVTEFGMSELGPISVGEGGPNPFLGRSAASNHETGPALQDKIDAAWVKLVNDCYKETMELLKTDADCIRKIATVLLAKETILGPEFEKLRNESKCAIKTDCGDCGVDQDGSDKDETGTK